MAGRGGNSGDDGFDIATDPNGNVYVTGRTVSTNFPTAGNPVQLFFSGGRDAFVAKISAPPTGSPTPPPVAGSAGSWAGLTQKCKGSGTKLKCLINGVLNVHNPGDETAAQSVIWFFLSNDETLDEGDLLLDEVKVGSLEAGETEEINLHVKLSKGQSASGQFGIAVLDATNVVPEQNEENNIVVSPPVQ